MEPVWHHAERKSTTTAAATTTGCHWVIHLLSPFFKPSRTDGSISFISQSKTTTSLVLLAALVLGDLVAAGISESVV
jgi:hypothetical protein